VPQVSACAKPVSCGILRSSWPEAARYPGKALHVCFLRLGYHCTNRSDKTALSCYRNGGRRAETPNECGSASDPDRRWRLKDSACGASMLCERISTFRPRCVHVADTVQPKHPCVPMTDIFGEHMRDVKQCDEVHVAEQLLILTACETTSSDVRVTLSP